MKAFVLFASTAFAAPSATYDAPVDPAPVEKAPVDNGYDAAAPADTAYVPPAPVQKPYDDAAPVDNGTYDNGAAAPVYNGDVSPVDDSYDNGDVSPVDAPQYEEPAAPAYGDVAPVENWDYEAAAPVDNGDAAPVYNAPSYGEDVSPVDNEVYYDDVEDIEMPYVDDVNVYPAPTETKHYTPCEYYDDVDNLDECLGDVDDVDAYPTCEPITMTHYETSTKGTASCVYETSTVYETDVCDTTTSCVYETETHYDSCEPETVYETHYSSTHSTCAGTHTSYPTHTVYHFEYEPSYVHPIWYHTETIYEEPEPTTKVDYTTKSTKVTETHMETKYDSITVKTTPVVTKTMYEGCYTDAYYKTEYAAPTTVYETKTIYVPKPCVDDGAVDPIDVCPKPTPYGEVDPIDVAPSYGEVDDVAAGPSYGEVDDVIVDEYDNGEVEDVSAGPGYGAVDPVDVAPKDDYEPYSAPVDNGAVDPVNVSYGGNGDVDNKPYEKPEYDTGDVAPVDVSPMDVHY